MDRERLKEVHATDLTESRVNEDFVDWLKTKGPTWLLVLLVGMCAYLAIVRYRQHQQSYRAEAWVALQQCELPGSFEDVAEQYGDVDQVANFARLRAAEMLLMSVQSGLTLDAEVTLDNQAALLKNALPDEERARFIERADLLYEQILDTDDGSPGMTVMAVNAMNGKAALAECRGEADTARSWYEKAAGRAEAVYPGLAEQARARAASVDEVVEDAIFPTDAEIAQRSAQGAFETRRPVDIDAALEPLLLPEEGDAGDAESSP